MSLILSSPEQSVQEIVAFLKKTYQEQQKERAVIAVSGGIDSALSLALLAQALPKDKITPLFLPYNDQPTADAEAMASFLSIPQENWRKINIAPIVDAASTLLILSETEKYRRGNLMARARMMVVYDSSKELNALVCGTENKSEHFLGYYTRFGDAASDIEPISHLYKTNVRQLAEYLAFPPQFLSKAPTAGLWKDQTDEQEMGFTYEIADQVLYKLVDEHRQPETISLSGVDPAVVQAVLEQVKANRFKFHVPYVMM